MVSLLLSTMLYATPASLLTQEQSAKAAAATPGLPKLQRLSALNETSYRPLAATELPKSLQAKAAQILANPKAPHLLLPTAALKASDTLIVAGPHWFSVSYSQQGVTVTLLVRRAAISASWLAKHRVNGPVISRSHGVVTVDFAAGGSAVTLDIECLGGDEHPRCGKDDEVWKVANDLRWVRKP